MAKDLVIAPSILSADFARLGEEVAALERGAADWVHVDVMDGRFVPNLTIGPPVVAALRRCTSLPLDVHLMIEEPERSVEAYAEAGADSIVVHAEASVHLHRTLQQIKKLGKRAGVVLNPSTSEESVRYVLDLCDLILVMSVNPGFGGQAFLPEVLPKVSALAAMIEASGRDVRLQIDGGISAKTIAAAAAAGADTFVAGNAVFSHPEGYGAAIAELRGLAQGARS